MDRARRQKIGLIILLDIEDSIPLFDLRLANNIRGKGIGTKAVQWMKDYIFQMPDEKIRFEVYTRSDNIAMRKVLHKCGFLKEGYLRKAWKNRVGQLYDCVIYGMTRADWENKTTTPINFNDLPF